MHHQYHIVLPFVGSVFAAENWILFFSFGNLCQWFSAANLTQEK